MQQKIFYGQHYEIGNKFGQQQAADNVFILNKLPFALNAERRRFAAACLPIYQHFFPEIIAEINGLANGQGCAAADIQTVLFSMYALPPADSGPLCSCLALTADNQILLGRNSDFLIALQDLNMNTIYHFAEDSGSAGFSGNTTAFIEMEDGVNQYGLALGLTSVAPAQIQPGFNAGLLLRYLLEKCQNVSQVIAACQKLPVASAQTIIAADQQGEIALLEICAQRTEVILPQSGQPFVCATNQFSSSNMQTYQNRQVDNWQAAKRLHTMESALQNCQGRLTLAQVQALLAGQNGFICQYDTKSGHDTVWSVVYDLKHGGIYRASGNPSRTPFVKDNRFSW